MLELLTLVIFLWLLVKTLGLSFRLTWGIAKILAGILIVLAFPVLFLCLVFVGGVALLVPIGMIVLAGGILKACVS